MKKIKINIVNIGIIFIIVTIFHNFSLAKNIYSIAKYEYDLRLSNTYDYCDNESIGFLSYIKKKYKINDEIQINNYFISPNPSWFFKLSSNKVINDKMVLLGYQKNYEVNFLNKNGDYFSDSPIKILNNIENISFNIKNKNTVIKLKIYQLLFGEKNIIYESSSIKLDEGNQTVNLNLSLKNTHSNAHLIIKLYNNNNKKFEKVSNVRMRIKNDINLENHTIYETSGSCYLISKND
tara:strand:- start:181 stop:888 length:708 start_codon:yes stop_codon:yes gene_type:complete